MDMRALLEVEDLEVSFTRRGFFSRQTIAAVRGVSFAIYPQETLGLVGESGCGKTTTGRAILRLVAPTKGRIRFAGEEIRSGVPGVPVAFHKMVQVVFQNPHASINPRFTVGRILAQAVSQTEPGSTKQVTARVVRLLESVGLGSYHMQRLPRELSGGQCQRVGIARALAIEPSLLVLDEPVSALDVSTQSQIINLLEDLKAQLSLSYLFISHDLALVRHISDRIAVMYRGRIVEQGAAESLYQTPRHPYTKLLLESILVPDPVAQAERKQARRQRSLAAAKIEPRVNPFGCAFYDRCSVAMQTCATIPPTPIRLADGTTVECHLYQPA